MKAINLKVVKMTVNLYKKQLFPNAHITCGAPEILIFNFMAFEK